MDVDVEIHPKALKQLQLFERQYLQLLPLQYLTWPAPESIRSARSQEWAYKYCFDVDTNAYLPPSRYRFSALKRLVAEIERSIVDPEEDVRMSIFYHIACPYLQFTAHFYIQHV